MVTSKYKCYCSLVILALALNFLGCAGIRGADPTPTPQQPTPDTTAPTVSVSAPASDATLSGTVALSANASDNVGVTGVQFLVNGTAVGAEVTTSPYSVNWDTTAVSNGSGYSITARARDAAGNQTTSTAVSVTVNNLPPGTLKTRINHIVLMMQENRSFDHYVGQLNAYRASKGLPADVDDLSKAGAVALPSRDGSPPIAPFKMNSACTGNLSPSWVESHVDMDMGSYMAPRAPFPMDGFAHTAGGFAQNNPSDPGSFDVAGKRAMGYYDADQLPFYYWAATTFATSDRWFSPVPTRTQPNRMFFLAATSNGYVFPGGGTTGHPPLTMSGRRNIFQLLEENGITWKVYVTDNWAPGKSGSTYMNYFSSFTSAHLDHFADAQTFIDDANNGTLPQVALIETGVESGRDEHPLNPIDNGAKYARAFVKALMDSPSWKDSVFFITFDEGGGLYDHVAPVAAVSPDDAKQEVLPTDPPVSFELTGFRVPLFIFSPFAKPGYVSHTNADYTALLKFIQARFDLPSLTRRDAAQVDANGNSIMEEFFDFTGDGPNLASTNPPEQPTLPCYFDRLP
jgi:phospholipase C